MIGLILGGLLFSSIFYIYFLDDNPKLWAFIGFFLGMFVSINFVYITLFTIVLFSFLFLFYIFLTLFNIKIPLIENYYKKVCEYANKIKKHFFKNFNRIFNSKNDNEPKNEKNIEDYYYETPQWGYYNSDRKYKFGNEIPKSSIQQNEKSSIAKTNVEYEKEPINEIFRCKHPKCKKTFDSMQSMEQHYKDKHTKSKQKKRKYPHLTPYEVKLKNLEKARTARRSNSNKKKKKKKRKYPHLTAYEVRLMNLEKAHEANRRERELKSGLDGKPSEMFKPKYKKRFNEDN